jgi:hypothetical protein
MLTSTEVHRPEPLAITRPNDTTTYAAGDVYGTAANGAFEWQGFIPGGSGCMITGLQVASSATATSNTALRIHFFTSNPTPGVTDNAALPVLSINNSIRLGMIDLAAARTGGAGSTAAVSQSRAPGDFSPILVPDVAGSRSVWVIVEPTAARAGVAQETLSLHATTVRA